MSSEFQQVVFAHYMREGRSLPWRETQDPYAILVSEVMLQQTQAERVVPKYEHFLTLFPTVVTLAAAPATEVLQAWQGLGYNRRGLNLQKAAHHILKNYGGRVPEDEAMLQTLPGIGPYTAAAIRVFAFNLPAVVIETNIRRAYLHHFFPGQEGVADRELLPLIAETMDRNNPRQWYQALMDYGAWLVRQVPNPNRRSKHYAKQGKFSGSDRQIRGVLLRRSLAGACSLEEVAAELATELPRVQRIAEALVKEGFPLRIQKNR